MVFIVKGRGGENLQNEARQEERLGARLRAIISDEADRAGAELKLRRKLAEPAAQATELVDFNRVGITAGNKDQPAADYETTWMRAGMTVTPDFQSSVSADTED